MKSIGIGAGGRGFEYRVVQNFVAGTIGTAFCFTAVATTLRNLDCELSEYRDDSGVG